MRCHAVVAALFAPALLYAQRSDSLVTLSGRVIDDADSGGIARASITLTGSSVHAFTDGWGYYRLVGAPRGVHDVVVRAFGYAKLTQSEDLPTPGTLRHDFYLTRLPHTLAQLVIDGRSMRVPRGFEEIYRRGARGWGVFITREQIDSADPIDLKTMLAAIPGVHVNEQGVFFQRCPASWNPQLWIDGQRVSRFKRMSMPDGHTFTPTPPPDPYFINEFLTELKPSAVQAVEVYRSNSETPAEFLDGSGCGVVAIWTKRGP